ncbi:AAA family ATPase [Pseudomonas sp. NBRC 111137]|uniref:AAA family ATPase n=1 Tax=Pseudomonas sp. NBRC 111137 TaxID=1661052 RepID=UPI0006D47727|nr:ATP-binding protein [Pseudomonas sp. NBRC 111137]
MYLTKLEISGIRSHKNFVFQVPEEKPWGWHVILGDNGAGKSSFVKSLALALAGPTEARALRQDWSTWLRAGSEQAIVTAHLTWNPEVDSITGQGRAPVKKLVCQIMIESNDEALSTGAILVEGKHKSKGLERTLWGRSSGWFSASFGPFRRFTGGNRDYERMFYTNPRLAPHLTAFGEDIALTECLEWLKSLHIKQLESGDDSQFLDSLIAFINNGELLPHGSRISRISSEEIIFVDGNGNEVSVDFLSDGYRSILSLTFELIRQLTISYGQAAVAQEIQTGAISLPGIVVIDEVDAHLHPSWQKRIAPWFLSVFPRLQFIVTTHSPIICQAAEHGSVWRLPTPGTDESGGQIQGDTLNRLIFGNILEAYDTSFFGADVSRSETSRSQLLELAQLNRKQAFGELSENESMRIAALRATMPTAASVAERSGLEVE